MKWAPITSDGSVVKKGDLVTSFRNEQWIYLRVSRPPEPGKTGKITVQEPGNPGNTMEYYDSVFNLRIEGFDDS